MAREEAKTESNILWRGLSLSQAHYRWSFYEKQLKA